MIEDHFKWIKVWENLIVNEDYVSKTVLDYNYNHFYNKANWNKELLDAWHAS